MSSSFDAFSVDDLNTNSDHLHHHAAADNDDTFSGYGAFSSFSPVDHTSAAASPEIFGFSDPDPSYSQSPFEPVHVVENGNGNRNGYGDDDSVFVSDGPVLPPPGEMDQEEGYALREWRR